LDFRLAKRNKFLDLKGNNDSKLLPWEVTTPLIRTILDGAVSKEDKLSITKLAEKP
tara:strand:+ start:66 stop:233 length:168 start_codon:yes stop_codon:yes gene_type:complete